MVTETPTKTYDTPMVKFTSGGVNDPNPTLLDAWQVFADFDLNAIHSQARFRQLRRVILSLGVVATVMAILYENYFAAISFNIPLVNQPFSNLFRVIVVLLPITVSMLLTWANKFERGLNYVLLRGAAETIKREIFEFRAKYGEYNDASNAIEPREIKLWQRVQTISERLMKTEVNKDGLETYKGKLPPKFAAAEGDDGFSFLTPEDYIRVRLEDQLHFYQGKVVKYGKKTRQLNWRIILFGALGTALAAFGFEIWIAATTTIVGAITTYLEYNQYENTLIGYNQANRDLESIRMWWRATPALEKESHSTYERLVQSAESVLSNEHGGWIQNMKDALEKLAEDDEKLQEEMEEIVEKFQNNPDGWYFYGEDPDVIPQEILADAAEATISGGSIGRPASVPSASSLMAGKAEPEPARPVDTKARAEAAARAAAVDALLDLVDEDEYTIPGEPDALADEAVEDLMEEVAEAFIEPDNAEESVGQESQAYLDAVAEEVAEGELPPQDLTPEMLEDLFGEVNADEEDDDLSDLFGKA